MRSAAALLVLAGMGLLAGRAMAQLPTPTVPTTTVPTVTVPPPPPLPAPLPTIPKLPAPAPALPQPAPSTPSVGTSSTPSTSTPSTSGTSTSASTATSSATASASKTLSSVTGTGTSTSRPSQSSSSQSSSSQSSGAATSRTGATASSGSGTTRRPRVKHFDSSRTWIATSGKRARRVTTLTFVLPRATRVYFTVTQVSPECELIGRFSVRGKAGLNRVRFMGRVGRHRLGPGTYRIGARTKGGSVVERVILVVVARDAPARDELAAARASNACSAATRSDSSLGGTIGASDSGFLGASDQIARPLTPQGQPRASAPDVLTPDTPLGGVLATSIEETAKAIRPILIVLLAASILLLGLASLPRLAAADARFNELLARHRLEIAGVGTAALLAFAITYLVA